MPCFAGKALESNIMSRSASLLISNDVLIHVTEPDRLPAVEHLTVELDEATINSTK